jgi:hypothetical protein
MLDLNIPIKNQHTLIRPTPLHPIKRTRSNTRTQLDGLDIFLHAPGEVMACTVGAGADVGAASIGGEGEDRYEVVMGLLVD